MASRNIKVFSMSFLDLLCCGLGAVILLNLLMIISIRREAAGALDHTYFIADFEVWIRISYENKAGLDGIVSPSLKGAPDFADELDDWFPIGLAITYYPKGSFNESEEFRFFDSEVRDFHATEIHYFRKESTENSFVEWNGKWYYRFKAHAWGLRVPQGVYSFSLSFENEQDGGGVGFANIGDSQHTDHMCRIELQGSGIGGHQIFQTHDVLPTEINRQVTDAQVDKFLEAFGAYNPNSGETITQMKRSRIPVFLQQDTILIGKASSPRKTKELYAGESAFELVDIPGQFVVTSSSNSNANKFLKDMNWIFDETHNSDIWRANYEVNTPALHVTAKRN